MNSQKATPHNPSIPLSADDCKKLLELLAQARVSLNDAPGWLVITQKLGWKPAKETLDALAALVSEAHRRGEWTPGREE